MQRFVLLIAIITNAISLASGQESARLRHFNLNSDKLALEGYDPVSYIKDKKAVEGKRAIFFVHEGARYQFATEANKEIFRSSPSTYEPQYGGWCAYAMGAKGEKVEVDPETFKVVNGKLYLFYNRFFNNTLDTWNKDENTLRAKADTNWAKLTTQ